MTQEELKKYSDRMTEISQLTIDALHRKDYSTVRKYAKEIKDIKKILTKAHKEAKKKEKMSSILG